METSQYLGKPPLWGSIKQVSIKSLVDTGKIPVQVGCSLGLEPFPLFLFHFLVF